MNFGWLVIPTALMAFSPIVPTIIVSMEPIKPTSSDSSAEGQAIFRKF